MAKTSTQTPLMKQHDAIKAKYPGALLLFRVGDFYEIFGKDAVNVSRILDITLTKRGKGSSSEIELAGFPHHALDSYLPKLVRAGYRIAICDQLEDPRFVKGIVKRGVTELITPGVSIHDHILEKKRNNFLAAIHIGEKGTGIALLDISTGEFYAAQGNKLYIDKLIQNFTPAEIVFSKAHASELEEQLAEEHAVFSLEEWIFTFDYAHTKLCRQFNTSGLKGFGISKLHDAVIAAGAILYYLEMTNHKDTHHISSISRINEDKYVWIDKFTIRNLEILKAQQEEGIPLISILDKTVTPMGSRLMRNWIMFPLREKAAIEERLNVAELFYLESDMAEQIAGNIRSIADLERLISKVATRRINPRELFQLKKSLHQIFPIQDILKKQTNSTLIKLGEQLEGCDPLLEKMERELCEDPAIVPQQGLIINEGINEELDELRAITSSSKEKLLEIRKREIANTGISSLKISFNKIFGYYLEISNTHKNKIPPNWIRKQTLVNGERYVTEELKEYENKILHAEEKREEIERNLFQELVRHTSDFIPRIQQNARAIATLDCLLSFSQVARANHYVKPRINETGPLEIKKGRHPVIEKQLPVDESYVPNDVFIDDKTQQILIITGPNMAGKSAFLRQTALIVLMAQIGSFVPAESVSLGIVDKIFTRVGASDNLSRGESTFMVEMIETASILNNVSTNSLVLMDEIGRGTSTYDGVSIAWSTVEYIHNHKDVRPKTLFATHYHELNQLAETLTRVKNYNISVKEIGDKIIFMRELKEGGSEYSFGIHVARLAGMPKSLLVRANEILRFLEKEKNSQGMQKEIPAKSNADSELSRNKENSIIEKIEALVGKIDLNTLTPIEALLKLNEIVSVINKN